MRVKVLIPSEDYRTYAGARIRYGRLTPELAAAGVHLELQDIGEFVADRNDCDVLLISKCHDARSLIAAAAANSHGQSVGVDLFDDYFSQVADSRLLRYRTWLNQLLPSCHFVLCSTPAIAAVVEGLRTEAAVHVVNDPSPVIDVTRLSEVLSWKFDQAWAEGRLRLAWFGVGDNPHFKVGLTDLRAHADTLHRLRQRGVDVELTVLTNARALTAAGLESVAQLPVRTKLEEWTEDRESEVLRHSFACFLPVNAQPFSTAKSLNRAVTALAAGCQVISVGYPLYARLGELIYRDIDQFFEDYKSNSMKLSPSTVEAFQSCVGVVASASTEAANLSEFLQGLRKRSSSEVGRLALIHGQSTTDGSHQAVRTAGGLSVASPFCVADFDFDVAFKMNAGRLRMFVTENASKRMLSAARDSLRPARNAAGRKILFLPEENEVNPPTSISTDMLWDAPLPTRLAKYGLTMSRIKSRLEIAFGPCRVFLSENSTLPFNPVL